MTPQLQTILSELKARLTELYGERLEKLVLFGSRPQVEEESEAEIRVVVVLKEVVSRPAELERISHVTTDLIVRHGPVITTLVVTKLELETGSQYPYPMIREQEVVL